jgi:hypothetical protein
MLATVRKTSLAIIIFELSLLAAAGIPPLHSATEDSWVPNAPMHRGQIT